jgi:rubrerythrin
MSFFLVAQNDVGVSSRRVFLRSSGLLLSASAVALLAGCDTLAGMQKGAKSESSDVAVLNSALGAEYEGIAAYQVGAESGLLEQPILKVALQFQGHHKQHADVLAKTITKLGGAAISQKDKYTFPTDKLKTQADVLRFAAQLEKGAVSAYLGAVPAFNNRDLAKAAASILGDEAMHWAVLRSALGEDPVPVAFMS